MKSTLNRGHRSAAAGGWILAIAIVSMLACTSGEDLSQLHRQIADVQRDVQELRAATVVKGDLAGIESQMQEGTDKIQSSNSELVSWVAELQQQIEVLSASLDLTTRQLRAISEELAAARAELEAAAQPARVPPAMPDINSQESSGSGT
jgi:chromosome segregation ATPase